MTIGRNIRAIRLRQGLTLEALCALSGISQDELGQYERGETTPREARVRKLAQALKVPIAAVREGMGWTAPQAAEGWEAPGDEGLLYQGILENLRESYGSLDQTAEEGPFLVGEEGFLLEESDIRALLESVKASIPALIEYMKDTRPEAVINQELLGELGLEDQEEERQAALTEGQWERLRVLLPPEKTGRGRAFKSNRLMLEGILWWMQSGKAWKDLPKRYGRYKCVSGRLHLWQEAGVWGQVLEELIALGILDAEDAGEHPL